MIDTEGLLGRAERRADARDAGRAGLVRGPADDVGDLDMRGPRRRVADLVRDVVRGERDQVLVHRRRLGRRLVPRRLEAHERELRLGEARRDAGHADRRPDEVVARGGGEGRHRVL